MQIPRQPLQQIVQLLGRQAHLEAHGLHAVSILTCRRRGFVGRLYHARLRLTLKPLLARHPNRVH
jgi:hypothetical protein